jgi:hypothetical protein
MGTPSRFPNGISTDRVGMVTGNYPLPNPSDTIEYFNDFNTYAAGDWTVNAGGGGSGNALSAGVGGILTLTAATSGVQSIKGNGSFAFKATTASATGTQMWFNANVTLSSTVANPDYQLGLVKGTMSSALNETDGVYFWKKTGATVAGTDTAWNLIIKAAAGSTTTIRLPTATLPVDAATVQMGYYYDAKPDPTLFIYWNGNCVGTVGSTGTLGTSLANLPASTILLSPCALVGWNTGTVTMGIDYMLVAQDSARI